MSKSASEGTDASLLEAINMNAPRRTLGLGAESSGGAGSAAISDLKSGSVARRKSAHAGEIELRQPQRQELSD